MKTIIRHNILMAVALLLAIQVYGASAGSVLLLKGKLKIQKADTFEVVETPNTRIEIMENDQVHTAGKTRAKITMRGQKETVHLYANSFLTLEKVDDDKSQVSLLIGKARFVVEPTTSRLSNMRRKFQIRTGNTFIGIRGTTLIVQTNGISTFVLTLAGLVGVANLANLDYMVELAKNQATQTHRKAAPTPAITVPESVVEEIVTTDEAEEWEGVEFEEEPETSDKEKESRDEEALPDDDLEAVKEATGAVDDARDQVQASSGSGTSIDFTVTEQE